MTNGCPFHVNNDGAFLFELLGELTEATQMIYDHFTLFGLQMHVGTNIQKLRTVAMYFPPSPAHAENQKTLPDKQLPNQ